MPQDTKEYAGLPAHVDTMQSTDTADTAPPTKDCDAPPSFPLINRPYKSKVALTLLIYMGIFSLGSVFAIGGPTILDLQLIAGTSTQAMSYIFSVKAVFGLAGAVIVGFTLERVNPWFACTVLLMVIGCANTVIPFCTDVVLMGAAFGVASFCAAAFDGQANMTLLKIWGEDNGPWIQALHAVFGAGTWIGPLIAKPFLVELPSLDHSLTAAPVEPTPTALTSGTQAKQLDHSLALYEVFNYTMTSSALPASAVPTEIIMTAETNVIYAYLILGVLCFVMTAATAIVYFSGDKRVLLRWTDVPESSDSQNQIQLTVHCSDIQDDCSGPGRLVASGYRSLVDINGIATSADSPPDQYAERISSADDQQDQNSYFIDRDQPETHQAQCSADQQNQETISESQHDQVTTQSVDQHEHLTFSLDHQHRDDSWLIRHRTAILGSLIFLFYVGYCIVEINYGTFVLAYAVKHLGWTKSAAASLTSAFWAAFTVGRISGIFLIRHVRPHTILAVDVVFCPLSLLPILLWADHWTAALWAGSIAFGLFMSTIYATGITWTGVYLPVSGRVASIFVTAGATGELVGPAAISLAFHGVGAGSFIYIMFSASLAVAFFMAVMQFVACKLPRKKQVFLEHELQDIE